ncbi:HEAT repeat domain-containing protein [Candidatus Lokiarchaeum ossiferum]|uniref:HEAT repeat domain-containing protein n=1 Tax=Candidatus Lokiarchaeum ossiferum TaxID=2951803 RepID=UPI00352FB1AF
MVKDEVEDLIYRLKFKNPKERVELINTLGNSGDIRATTPILQQLISKNVDLLVASIFALGKLKDARAVSSLVDLLNHKKEKVGKYAAQSLGKIGDPSAVESMCALLLQVKIPIAQYILESLGMIGAKEAVSSILLFIEKKKPKEELLATAIKALSCIKDPSAVSAIIPYLDDSNRNTRAFSAEALGISKDPKTIKILIDHLSDPDDYVIEKIVESLGNLNPSFKEKSKEEIVSKVYLKLIKTKKDLAYQEPEDLITLLKKEKDSELKVFIIHQIGEKQVSKALKPLVKMQKSETNIFVLKAIQEALDKLNYLPKDLEKYINQFRSDDFQRKLNAVSALSMIQNDSVFEELFSYLKNNYQNQDDQFLSVNSSIIDALSKYELEKTIEFYKKIYQSCPIELYDAINGVIENSMHPIAKSLLSQPYRSDGRWGKPLSLMDMGFKKAAKKEEKHLKEQEKLEKQKIQSSIKAKEAFAIQKEKEQIALKKKEQEKLRLETKQGLKKQKEQKKRDALKAKELEKHKKELAKREAKRKKQIEKSTSGKSSENKS